MPFTAKDALRHTKKANTKAKRKKWARIANGILRESQDEGKAIRLANLAVKT
jgi:uncharacterized protein YdaT